MNMPVLDDRTLTALRTDLPATASACVEAIVAEVPGYDRGFGTAMARRIERAVEQALSAFIDAAGSAHGNITLASRAMQQGAYQLGEGEALAGRSTDALMMAYRVGARVSWKTFAKVAVAEQEPADAVAKLAEDTFAFIDELSAQSLAGHTAALNRRTRELSRRRDQLAAALARDEHRATLTRLAESARWRLPLTLSALVLAGDPPSSLLTRLGDHALWMPTSSGPAVVFVPDLKPERRAQLLKACGDAEASLGPAVAWYDVAESLKRAQRALAMRGHHIDTHDVLPQLVLAADPLTSSILAERVLEPISELSPAKQEVLLETMLGWILHQGRRDDVAAYLHVHPQTIRYRMNQIRDYYGEQFADPDKMLALVFGLVSASARLGEEADQ